VAKRSVLKRFQLVIDFLMRNLGLMKGLLVCFSIAAPVGPIRVLVNKNGNYAHK
jgi:hypothetical protein